MRNVKDGGNGMFSDLLEHYRVIVQNVCIELARRILDNCPYAEGDYCRRLRRHVSLDDCLECSVFFELTKLNENQLKEFVKQLIEILKREFELTFEIEIKT